ncbi:MAG: hypothetical protein RIQ62_219 [Bacteroidota bacterium]
MIHDILKKYWHFDTFRPLQAEIIEHILAGKDALAVMPTGGGKSICYQVPALALEGCCLVISPLIALMKDQVQQLEKKGIPALAVYAGQSTKETDDAYRRVLNGQYKFLFVSPERLLSKHFLEYLPDWPLGLIAVDEAHCISQWGYDFRPPYLEIAAIRNIHPEVPLLALTASATPAVQQDIMQRLVFREEKIFFTTFRRENLSFSCFQVPNKTRKCIEILQKIEGSALVYCRSRRACKELSAALQAEHLQSDFYHAGLDAATRSRKQDEWISNKTRIMVCTNAFGMGIDKADVRCVIHVDIPDSPEAYYQEAGRAGRDTQRAYAVLLYQQKDLRDLHNSIETRYPPADIWQKVYDSMAYYLEVPMYEGAESIFDIDVLDFCKTFSLSFTETMSSIRILEQAGYWTLSESVFLPSELSVLADREDLEALEKFHPDAWEILQVVLRLYGGLWHNYVNIRELSIAQHGGCSIDYVQHILRRLHHMGIISYHEAKDKPWLQYIQDRVPAKTLQVDTSLLTTLKQRYQQSVDFMCHYAENPTSCRALMITEYFEEKGNTPCGICDHCLAAKQKQNDADQEKQILQDLMQQIHTEGFVNIQQFTQKHSSRLQPQVIKIIRFLLDDRQLSLNDAGDLVKYS